MKINLDPIFSRKKFDPDLFYSRSSDLNADFLLMDFFVDMDPNGSKSTENYDKKS